MKKLTYKALIRELQPDRVNEDIFTGGVYGCPGGYVLKSNGCYYFDNCEECWNQELDANELAKLLELYGSEWYLNWVNKVLSEGNNE